MSLGLVESTIQRSSQIATLPAVAVQIIRLCEDPESTIEDLNNIVVGDPVLGVRILKLVNSAYYGMTGQIKTIKHAILLLGLRSVKNVVIAASLVKLSRHGKVGSRFSADDLWQHSIAVATGARILAQHSNYVSPDEAFLAGLIHDIGIVIEMQTFGAPFVKMIDALDADETLTFRKAEETELGASHETFGAGLCRAWNLPSSLQFATGYHHRPWELPEEHRRLPAIVHIADILAAKGGLGYTRTVESDSVDPLVLGYLNLREAHLERVVEELPEAIKDSQELFSDDM